MSAKETSTDPFWDFFHRDLPEFLGVTHHDKTHLRREQQVHKPIPGWEVSRVNKNLVFGSQADPGLVLGEEVQAGYATGFLIVIDFIEGGPAVRSGMVNIGDRLMAVNGVVVSGRPAHQVAARLEGREGSFVELSFTAAQDGRRFKINLPRRFPFITPTIKPARKEGKVARPPQRLSTAQINEGKDGMACSVPQQMADENVAVMSGPGPRLSLALDDALRSGGASTARSSSSGLRTTTIIW